MLYSMFCACLASSLPATLKTVSLTRLDPQSPTQNHCIAAATTVLSSLPLIPLFVLFQSNDYCLYQAEAGDMCILRVNAHCHLLAKHAHPTCCGLAHTLDRGRKVRAEAYLPPPTALPLMLIGQHCSRAGLTPNGHVPHLVQLVHRHALHSHTPVVVILVHQLTCPKHQPEQSANV